MSVPRMKTEESSVIDFMKGLRCCDDFVLWVCGFGCGVVLVLCCENHQIKEECWDMTV